MQCTMWDQYSLSLSPQQPRESPCCPHNPKSCSATTFSGRGFPRILPWYIHTQEHLPVIPAAVTVGVPEHLRDRERHIPSGTSHHTQSAPVLWAMLTLPFFCSLCLSFLLMCRSMLVSPRVMRVACHSVRAPRASATELGMTRDSRWNAGLPSLVLQLAGAEAASPHPQPCKWVGFSNLL